MRCDSCNKIGLDALVGRLTTFELDNIENYVIASKNVESTFEAILSLKEKGKKIKEIYGGNDNVKKALEDSLIR